MFKLFMDKPITKVSIASAMLLALTVAPSALAQTGAKVGSSGANQSQTTRDAPIGHRQPRADQVPSEKDLSNPSKEDVLLDRRIRGICRGC